jgi:GDP-L-fucose synthase
MPTNLYGPGDNFHPDNSHVLPALIRRFHEAVRDGVNEVKIWGSGAPRREFLHVDDMAEASLFIFGLDQDTYAKNTQPMLSHINVGYGSDISIADLAKVVGDITGFSGKISFDASKPDGTMKKLMDSSRLKAMGWVPKINFVEGVKSTYEWFCAMENEARSK